jgi:hypothetical protein
MKQGKSLLELAQEVERQQELKRDFIVSPSNLLMEVINNTPTLTLKHDHPPENYGQAEFIERFGLDRTAHDQIADRLGIPQRYYDRMLAETPDLLTENVNAWMRKNEDPRMLRTIGGNARAYLSNRYRRLDNLDLLETVLPVISQTGCRVESSDITPSNLYLKVVNERIQGEVKVGDIVQAGLVISNSEIGKGSVKVEPLVYRLICKNGAVTNGAMKKYHVGRESIDESMFRDETLQADDRAFWMKVQDTVQNAFNKDLFSHIVSRMQDASQTEIKSDPVRTCELTAKRYGLSEDERGSIVTHLIRGGDLSQYGLMNAVTRASQDIQDYERATTLERLGGTILELSRSDFHAIAA